MTGNGNLWVNRDAIQHPDATQSKRPVGWVAENLVNRSKSYRLYNKRDNSIAQNRDGTIKWVGTDGDGVWESFKFANSNQYGW
jgi:hypothetical protein